MIDAYFHSPKRSCFTLQAGPMPNRSLLLVDSRILHNYQMEGKALLDNNLISIYNVVNVETVLYYC